MTQSDKLERQEHFLSTRIAVLVLSFISCTLWGSAPTFIKMGYESFSIGDEETMSIILFAGVRFAIAGLMVILFYSISSKKLILPRRTSWKAIVTLSLSQTVVQYVFLYIGVAHASGMKTSILSGTSSVISMLLACLVFHQEKLTRNKAAGCIMGFLGIVLVNLSGSSETMTFDMSFKGEGLVLLSYVSGAVSAVLIRQFSQSENPVMLSGWQFFCGGISLCVISVIAGGRLETVTGSGILIVLYLGLVSAVAYTLRSLLLKYNPVSSVTVYNFLIPVAGVIMAWMFLGEKDAFTMNTFIAMLLICGSIWVINFAERGGSE